jgi:hypothetical protein
MNGRTALKHGANEASAASRLECGERRDCEDF